MQVIPKVNEIIINNVDARGQIMLFAVFSTCPAKCELINIYLRKKNEQNCVP